MSELLPLPICGILHRRTKFEVFSFNRSRDIEGPKISNVVYVTPFTALFDLILHLFDSTLCGQSACQL